ncbi:MAG: hypothetical protein KF832_11270 [Caldilineaceae bacterium]|nr:hypothetical protein [Caldilineaceae bacterium]
MWKAEIYSAYQAGDSARAMYQKYRDMGGEPKLALRRLVQIAALHQWCLTQTQMLLTLATTLSSKADAYQAWGDVCIANRQIETALDAYRQAFEISPERIIAGKLAAVLFQRAEAASGTDPAARLAYFAEVAQILKAVTLQPEDSHQYYLLAWSEWQLNHFDDAIVAYETCVATPRQADRYAFSCALNLGYAYSAWLPATSWDLPKATFYFRHAQLLAFDDSSRLAAQHALQRLEGLEP